jgi:transposase
MPRPTKWTRELQRQICTSLATGAYVETAAALHGVSKVTLYDWFKRGNAGEEPYVGFLNAIKSAEAQSEQTALGRIDQASLDPKNWTAAAWRLERKHPDRWGRRDKVDLSIEGEVEHVHHFEPSPEFMANVVQNLRDLNLAEPEAPILLEVAKTPEVTEGDDLVADGEIDEYDAASGEVRPHRNGATPPPSDLGVIKLRGSNPDRWNWDQ